MFAGLNTLQSCSTSLVLPFLRLKQKIACKVRNEHGLVKDKASKAGAGKQGDLFLLCFSMQSRICWVGIVSLLLHLSTEGRGLAVQGTHPHPPGVLLYSCL